MIPIEIEEITSHTRGPLFVQWDNLTYRECDTCLKNWWQHFFGSAFSHRDCFHYIAVDKVDHFQFVLECQKGWAIVRERIGDQNAGWSAKVYSPGEKK